MLNIIDLQIYIIIHQCPSVCTHAISSHICGQIWILKVPMDSLGQGGPNKTICKVMGSKMKKKYYWRHPFYFTTYLAFHFGLCVWSTFWPLSHQAISNLSTDLDSLGQGGSNKTICKVMGPEMKKKILGTPFLILLPT